MASILVVDDQEIVRFTIIESLRDQGHQTFEADDGVNALAAARLHHPDLILLDVLMPGADGFTVLTQMQADDVLRSIPVVMLTRDAKKDDVHGIIRLGVKGYILKTCFEMEDFIARINTVLEQASRATAAAGVDQGAMQEQDASPRLFMSPWKDRSSELDAMQPLHSRDQAELSFDARQLRCMGAVARQVAAMSRSKDYSVDDVSRIIKADPVIALRVLQVANANAYSAAGPVITVERAVSRMGMAAIADAVMALPSIDDSNLSEVHGGISVLAHAEHGMACGMLCADIVASCGGTDDEIKAAHLAGLLHDLGKRIMSAHLDEKYARTIEVAERLRLPLDKVESRLLYFDHAESLSRLLTEWGIPQTLIAPIAHHHRPVREIRRLAAAGLKATAAVAMADRLAHGMILGGSDNPMLEPVAEYLRVMELDMPAFNARMQSLPDRLTELKALLLGHGMNVNWPRHSLLERSAASTPVHALYAADVGTVDPHGLFFRHLAALSGDCQPNLVVVPVNSVRALREVSQQVTALERQHQVVGLPVLVLTQTGKLYLTEDDLPGRDVMALPFAVHIADMLEAAYSLLMAIRQSRSGPDTSPSLGMFPKYLIRGPSSREIRISPVSRFS